MVTPPCCLLHKLNLSSSLPVLQTPATHQAPLTASLSRPLPKFLATFLPSIHSSTATTIGSSGALVMTPVARQLASGLFHLYQTV